jgi:hypothetical protein
MANHAKINTATVRLAISPAALLAGAQNLSTTALSNRVKTQRSFASSRPAEHDREASDSVDMTRSFFAEVVTL